MRLGNFYWELPTSFPALSISSFYFVAFALIVFALSRIFKNVFRPYVLFIANILFLWSFSRNFYYLIVIGICGILSYIFALILNKTHNKIILGIAIVPYVLLLIFFKYQGILFNENLLMPLGLSFYTFKIISYLFDVYKDKIKAEKNPIYYLDYVMFFPCITTGPINRAEGFLKEIRNRSVLNYKDAKHGGLQMMLGIFEKIVFSDFIASQVTLLLDNPEIEVIGIPTILGVILYSFQIYLDFDACSNIAIGSARLLGFDVGKNFNSPYLAKNLKEFWRRWHISLSTFFRDYIYIPLGGSRKGKVKAYLNTLIVFIVSGLWHGNTFNFFIWGLLHGIISIIEGLIDSALKNIKLPKFIQYPINLVRIALNFAIVTLLWLVFRYQNMAEVITVINRMLSSTSTSFETIGMTIYEYYWTFVILFITVVMDILRNFINVLVRFSRWPFILRWLVYILLIATFLIFGMYGGSFDPNDFIYQAF